MSIPSSPYILSIDSENESLTVNFIPPQNDGGYPITYYLYSIDNGITYEYSNYYQSPIKINNLVNGVQYEIKIVAANAEGSGKESNMVIGVPSV